MNAFKNLTDILGLEKIRVLYLALTKSIIYFSISIWRGTYKMTINSIKKIYIFVN